jgi:ABC-type sulfate transport system substrate-binding protein
LTGINYVILLDVELNFVFVSKLGIFDEIELQGVRITTITYDDVDGESCGTAKYPLVTAINYALRNNMSRQNKTAESSGKLHRNLQIYHKDG